MDDKPKRSFPPPTRGTGFVRQLIEQVRLSWALMFDNRVPIILKVIPLAAIAYVVSPVGIALDFIPILGPLLDVGVLMLALVLLNQFAPEEAVSDHLSRLRSGERRDGTTIDVEAKKSDSQR